MQVFQLNGCIDSVQMGVVCPISKLKTCVVLFHLSCIGRYPMERLEWLYHGSKSYMQKQGRRIKSPYTGSLVTSGLAQHDLITNWLGLFQTGPLIRKRVGTFLLTRFFWGPTGH